MADASDTHDPVSLWLERDARDGDHLAWTHNKNTSVTGYDAADLRGRAALREVVRLRNSTIFRVDKDFADAGDSYRATRRSIAADRPAARSFFDVYIDGSVLVYVRDSCARADTTSRFMLHVFRSTRGIWQKTARSTASRISISTSRESEPDSTAHAWRLRRFRHTTSRASEPASSTAASRSGRQKSRWTARERRRRGGSASGVHYESVPNHGPRERGSIIVESPSPIGGRALLQRRGGHSPHPCPAVCSTSTRSDARMSRPRPARCCCFARCGRKARLPNSVGDATRFYSPPSR